MSSGVFGIMAVRNEADLVEINLRYHLSLGLERILVIDNGSTDGTQSVLSRLSKEFAEITWRPDDGQFHQSQMMTALAREAYFLGAQWVMPIDADEFWWCEGTTLAKLLAETAAGALRVTVINFIQRRQQRVNAPWALHYATMRVAEPVGSSAQSEQLVEERRIAYVQAPCPDKWLTRASASLTIAAGSHIVEGFAGARDDCGRLTIMHVPLRSMSTLKSKAEQGRRVVEAGFTPGDAWHVRRWWRLEQEGELEREWRANSYDGGALDVFGSRQELVYDPRLRDALAQWLPKPPDDDGPEPRWQVEPRDRRSGSANAVSRRFPPAELPSGNAPHQTVVEMEAARRALASVLHDETSRAHRLAAEVRQLETEVRRLEAECSGRGAEVQQLEAEMRQLEAEIQRLAAEVHRQRTEAESQRQRVEALELQSAKLEAFAQHQREEADSARLDFDRLAASRLPRLSFALSATTVAVLRSTRKPSRAFQLLGTFAKDLMLRLTGRPIRVVVDSPADGAVAFGSLAVSGWALSGAAGVENVRVLLPDGSVLVESLAYGLNRTDVSVWIPWSLSSRCGFAGTVPLDSLGPGQHSLLIRVTDRAGNSAVVRRDIAVGRLSEVIGGVGSADRHSATAPSRVLAPLPEGSLANRRALEYVRQLGSGSSVADVRNRLSGPTSIDAGAKIMLHAFLSGDDSIVFPVCENPAVTIVIPTFRQAHYVYLTLQVLLANTKGIDYEVVIVDNASADETELLLRRLSNVRVHYNDSNVGFARACNQGAEMAKGAYVCFLNSDTLPAAGWLTALMSTIETYPECGAVGGKLIHPSGRLQEAGSVIWRDGSTAGYGRGGDPLDPQYCYVREVDYCSAACLLLRRDLFWRLGGFDERYGPAYCEDSDLCLAVWAAGYRVVYQPACSVLHVEGGSSTAGQAISLQLANRDKMAAKWRDVLAEHSTAAEGKMLFARDHRRGRRVLVIDDFLPHAGLGQGMPRAGALLRCLVELGYVVTFVPVQTNRFGADVSEFQQMGIEVLTGGQALRSELAARAGLFDVAVVSRPVNAELMPLVRTLNPAAAIVYDAEAIYAFRTIRQAYYEGSPLPTAEAEALVESEVSLVDEADLVLVVSVEDQQAMQRRRPERDVVVWGDCVEMSKDPPGFSARHDILFVAYLGSSPNADAARYFLEEVFPLIRSQLDCRLILVGADPTEEVVALASSLASSVELVGFADDLRPYYDGCRLFVAPHRYAAGLPHKVVEAIAAGIPCVVSAVLAGQLEFTDGAEAMVGCSAEELARKVVELYQDRELWERVQAKSMQVVRERYERAAARRALGECVERAVRVRAQARAVTSPTA